MSLSKFIVTCVCVLAVHVSAEAQPQLTEDPLAGLPGTTQEAPTVSLEDMPKGKNCTVRGETYRCFNLNEYKKLLTMVTEYRTLTQQHATTQATLVRVEEINDQLQTSLTLAESQITVLRQVRQQLYDKWLKENQLRYSTENKKFISRRVAWAVAVIEAAAIIGLIAGGAIGG